jgi:hypothetical protein
LAVPAILQTIEQTGISTWIRESDSIFGFYFWLTLHGIGMSLVVGGNLIIDLRILGFAKGLPLKPLKRLFTLMWAGLIVNVLTGIALLTAYPTKEVTNLDFYVKLVFVALGVITMKKLSDQVFSDNSLSEAAMIVKGQALAKWSLLFWFLAVTAGRLLSETATYDTYGHLAGG